MPVMGGLIDLMMHLPTSTHARIKKVEAALGPPPLIVVESRIYGVSKIQSPLSRALASTTFCPLGSVCT